MQFIPDLKTVDTVIEYLTVFSQALSSMNALVIAFLILASILLLNSIEYALNEVIKSNIVKILFIVMERETHSSRSVGGR